MLRRGGPYINKSPPRRGTHFHARVAHQATPTARHQQLPSGRPFIVRTSCHSPCVMKDKEFYSFSSSVSFITHGHPVIVRTSCPVIVRTSCRCPDELRPASRAWAAAPPRTTLRVSRVGQEPVTSRRSRQTSPSAVGQFTALGG